MEEYVGFKWHEYITGKASTDFEDATVALKDAGYEIGVLFRALGGDTGLRIEAATPRDYFMRRSFLQKLAGTHQQVELTWRDNETLRLPEKLAIFDSAQLNKYLYLWLAALAAQQADDFSDWFQDNQSLTQRVLAIYPGMKQIYTTLVEAFLMLRPSLNELEDDAAAQEQAIQQALREPGSVEVLPPAKYAPNPVYLWLYPGNMSACMSMPSPVEDDEGSVSSGKKKHGKRKQGERVESYDKNHGLMVFRLENLFSFSEFVPVDRAGDDTDEEDAESVADDLDVISVSRDRKAASSSIKFDLDLPASDNDDLRLGDGILLPEWDYRSQSYREDYCCLQPMLGEPEKDNLKADESDGSNLEGSAIGQLPNHLRADAAKLRRQFSGLKPVRQWQNRQQDGEELDLDNWLHHVADAKAGSDSSEQGFYRTFNNQVRDLSCLILADLSLSTDTWVNNDQRVIDVVQDSLQLLCEALSATGDRFSVYGFSSRKRDHVRYHVIKNFNERYSDQIRGRIQHLKPGYYTRMGAAIRQSIKVLSNEKSHQRVLMIITDGKPNDLDLYEGRYGVEDTRMAILEAKRAGLQPFCVTIDDDADEYLPYLFGKNGFVVIKDPAQLPKELPRLYVNLTR
ncbi:nitric oxide reductase activation protein NorD [Litoribrevibacter euphylliae]|uniref:Nitric oxide reductase activation protein NorD n=1 Tax=Litoribrevibacter euphylliae TaxID=1834034 RepID=A0ABV7HHC2_9GAMM